MKTEKNNDAQSHALELRSRSASQKTNALELQVAEIQDLATREQVIAVVERVAVELKKSEESTEKMRYLLGKAIAYVQDTWEASQQEGSFESWTQEFEDRSGLSRATLRKCLGVYRILPEMKLDQVARIPMTSLELVAKVARGTVTKRKVAGLLRRAEGRPIREFRESVEEEGLLPHRGESGVVTVTVRVKTAIAARWKRLVAGRDPGEVFAGLLAMSGHQGRRAA